MKAAKPRPVFVCEQCGAELSKWAGQCPECREWNCIVEFAAPARRSGGVRAGFSGNTKALVSPLTPSAGGEAGRISTGTSELDRVLGGGLVSGAALLIGGEPGIGKSTILMQLAASLSGRCPCLYVTGEESVEQLSMRAERLGVTSDQIRCLPETHVETILALAEKERPGVLIVDSVQTLFSESSQSTPGSVSQVRECAGMLVQWGKRNQCAVVLVGHVTKDGSLAGPRILEHMVDVVLYFESDGSSRYRVLRAVKNRHGAANELGMFAMTGKGLKEVRNPSAIFLSGNETQAAGSVTTAVRAGTRPLLLEVQALVDPSSLGQPRRVALGLDINRISMILAVLHRKGGISLGDHDVFINVVGGVRVSETGADLAILLALFSSFRDRPLPPRTVCFGELGLTGEIRPVADGEQRLKEAASHGFRRALLPEANRPRSAPGDLEIHCVRSTQHALEQIEALW
jgi:DNA repair protein RadA/Sms